MMSAATRSSPLLPRASCKTLQTTGFVIIAVCGRRTEVSARSAAGNSRRNTLRGGRQVRLVAGAVHRPRHRLCVPVRVVQRELRLREDAV